jgi:hypothetical protein
LPSAAGVRRSSSSVFVGRLPSNVRCGTSQSGEPSAFDLVRRLAEGQRFALREDVREQHVVMLAERFSVFANAMKSQGMSLVPW